MRTKSDNNSADNVNTGDVTCWDFAQNPDDGEAIIDEIQSLPPPP